MSAWAKAETQGGWTWTAPTGASIVIESAHPTARGLEAWVELRAGGRDVPLAQGYRDLMQVGAHLPFLGAAGLGKDAEPSAAEWDSGLRAAVWDVIEQHRNGGSVTDLTEVEPSPVRFLVEPLVESGGHTRLIAAGGSGKSLLALAVALTVATGKRFLPLPVAESGPVLYLDWETNAATHARRIEALRAPSGAAKPPKGSLLYRFESQPLSRSARSLRRICDAAGVVLVVIDSAKMAAGPAASSAGAEDSTLAFYLALREIARPALIIDHKTKEDIRKGRRGGYGSVFYENLARMQWEMTGLMAMTPTERSFRLELVKENNVGRVPPLGFILETTGGPAGLSSAQFRATDPRTLPDPDADDLLARVEALLGAAGDPLPVADIAAALFGELGKGKEGSIRARLNSDKRFVNVAGEGRRGLWSLHGRTDLPKQTTMEPDATPDDDDWRHDYY